MRYSIYTLASPLTGEIFYVGRTVNLKTRFKGHINLREADNELKNEIINHILEHSAMPIIEEIDYVECVYKSDEYEAHKLEMYWISQLAAWGFCLCNKDGLHNKGKYTSRYSDILKPSYYDELFDFMMRKATRVKETRQAIISGSFNDEEKKELLNLLENAWDESIMAIENRDELGYSELLYNKELQKQLQ